MLRRINLSVLALTLSTSAQITTNPIWAELERIHDNLPALHSTIAPSWVSAPNMRGTTSILYSCVLTLFACIYTALHLNVPNRTGIWDMALYKAKWAAVGLFVPEVLLYIAVSQFFEARQLQTRMKALVRERRSSQPGDPDEVCRASSGPAA